MLYYIILNYILLYYIILNYILLYYMELYYIILYYIFILYYTILYYISLYYILLCYVILYYIILYCIVLYYIILYIFSMCSYGISPVRGLTNSCPTGCLTVLWNLLQHHVQLGLLGCLAETVSRKNMGLVFPRKSGVFPTILEFYCFL